MAGAEGYRRGCASIRLELLDLLGREYVIEHCVQVLKDVAEERRYRAYVTDALMVLTENTARFAGGRRLMTRWASGLAAGRAQSGDDIAAEVMRRAGLRFKG